MLILKKYQNILFIIIVLFALVFAAFLRYNDITVQGISKGDSFSYLKEAKLWAEGKTPEFYGGKFYRPAIYFFQGLAIRLLGYNDYSVKIFNVTADMINILLIFLIMFLLTKSKWLGIIPVLLYSLNPYVLRFARSEYPHILSMTFVLLSFLFYLLYNNYYRNNKFFYKILLFISGFFVGLAANSHPDLAFLGVGYVICFLLNTASNHKKSNSYLEFFINLLVFSSGFIVPYAIGFIAFGFSKVYHVFSEELFGGKSHLTARYGKNPFLNLFSLLILKGLWGWIVRLSFIIGLSIPAIWIIDFLKGKKDLLIYYTPMILIFTYLCLYFILIGVFPPRLVRIFLPLFPLFFISVVYWYFKIFRKYFHRSVKIAASIILVAVFSFNIFYLCSRSYSQSQYRSIYDIIKNKINSKNKILIAPASVYSYDHGFQSDLYFGENAIYLYEMPLNETYSIVVLREFTEIENISYIFISKKIDERFMKPDFPIRGKQYKMWFRNKSVSYSLENDINILNSFIREERGILVKKTCWGSLYNVCD